MIAFGLMILLIFFADPSKEIAKMKAEKADELKEA